MIADEVHHKAFCFLNNTEDEVYKRINRVTMQYLGNPFCEVLPHRIGMSGTINQIAEQAFGKTSLYDLSIQRMIQENLVKKIAIDTQPIMESRLAYAKQIVVDYFSASRGLERDLFPLSKGLIFSKVADNALNQDIERCFNLLSQENLDGEDLAIQKELFERINAKRREPLDVEAIQQIHRTAFQNNIMAVYLEYILSKSTSPHTCSDIIGLQNTLYGEGKHLFDIHSPPTTNPQVKDILKLVQNADTRGMTRDDIQAFIAVRIKDSTLSKILIKAFLDFKNNILEFVQVGIFGRLINYPLNKLITTDLDEFESGKTLAMIGGEGQRTGYSHEPVGIIVDVPSPIETMLDVNHYISRLENETFTQSDVPHFLTALQDLAQKI